MSKSCGDETCLHLDCRGGCTIQVLHLIKLHETIHTCVHAHTHTHACKTYKVRISSLDCTNADFLVLVLFYGVMHEVITEGNQVKGT